MHPQPTYLYTICEIETLRTVSKKTFFPEHYCRICSRKKLIDFLFAFRQILADSLKGNKRESCGKTISSFCDSSLLETLK